MWVKCIHRLFSRGFFSFISGHHLKLHHCPITWCHLTVFILIATLLRMMSICLMVFNQLNFSLYCWWAINWRCYKRCYTDLLCLQNHIGHKFGIQIKSDVCSIETEWFTGLRQRNCTIKKELCYFVIWNRFIASLISLICLITMVNVPKPYACGLICFSAILIGGSVTVTGFIKRLGKRIKKPNLKRNKFW